jgi:hypothetical protein
MKSPWRIVTALLLLLGAFQASYAESGKFKTNSALLNEPSAESAEAGKVASGAAATILERKGFWVKVKSGPVSGWIKLSGLTVDASEGGSTLATVNSGRAGLNNTASSSGGRGLDNGDDFTRATPNPSAVAALGKTIPSPDQVKAFAAQASLQPRNLPYITPTPTK